MGDGGSETRWKKPFPVYSPGGFWLFSPKKLVEDLIIIRSGIAEGFLIER